MMLYRPEMVGCDACAFFDECGGIPQQSIWGCFDHCCSTCQIPQTCDLTCPRHTRLFYDRMGEIGGTFDYVSDPLKVPHIRLPDYVAKIHNGCSRIDPTPESIVALPARELVRKRGFRVSCEYKTPTDVRSAFCLSDKTRFVITCIGEDEDVEAIWQGLRYGRLANDFARIKPAAIVTPNFSFFVDDVPRTHTLYNRKRICLAAQLLSDAGCRVIVPIYALTEQDWAFWFDVLSRNPSMSYIAEEFQTGLSGRREGLLAIRKLAELQSRLDRKFHLVALGARKFTRDIARRFDNYTVLDSRPFMMSHKRRRLKRTTSGRWIEVKSLTARKEPVDHLLQHNIREQRQRIRAEGQ
jgi:hypothetical protein